MIENCTLYTEDYPEDIQFVPCQCPVCKGFLKWDENDEPICNKCGAELLKIPDCEDGILQEYGKVCAIGKSTKHPIHNKTNRLIKEGVKKWKAFL